MELKAFSAALADAVQANAESIVTVYGRRRQSASGIVWQADLVVTAEHVLQRDDNLMIVTADGTEHAAELVGRDQGNDIAVLRVTNAQLKPATFTSDELRVGEMVLAVGRPNTLQASLGIINALGGPVQTRRGTIAQYVRTDATPYPGFSGGALINVSGEIVGLFTSGLAHGEPVAIPASALAKAAENLKTHGRVRRGYLGIATQAIQIPANQRAGRNQESGLLIVNVEADSPAQTAGLLVGDILVAMDGHDVADPRDLQALLFSNRVGQSVEAVVIRAGALQTLNVTIGER